MEEKLFTVSICSDCGQPLFVGKEGTTRLPNDFFTREGKERMTVLDVRPSPQAMQPCRASQDGLHTRTGSLIG